MLYILAVIPLLFCFMLIEFTHVFALYEIVVETGKLGKLMSMGSVAVHATLVWITMCVCTSLMILALAIRK